MNGNQTRKNLGRQGSDNVQQGCVYLRLGLHKRAHAQTRLLIRPRHRPQGATLHGVNVKAVNYKRIIQCCSYTRNKTYTLRSKFYLRKIGARPSKR